MRFDGTIFQNEPSSKFSHAEASALGSYRKSPFITGDDQSENGLKTEIFDYVGKEWHEEADYPFSNGDR